jgi:hypothetical protein
VYGSLELKGVALVNGFSRYINATHSPVNGSAVYLAGVGTAIFTMCDFKNNTQLYPGYGGAVYLQPGANASFTLCNFTENSAAGYGAGSGGAVALAEGGDGVFTHASFTQCSFVSNIVITYGSPGGTTYGGGGAVSLGTGLYQGTGNPISAAFTLCDFISNSANEGGAVALNMGTHATFTSCNFMNNNVVEPSHRNAPDAPGGAVSLQGLANATFTQCNFTSNSAEDTGGAVSLDTVCYYADPPPTLGIGPTALFVACNFISNVGGPGGAVGLLAGCAASSTSEQTSAVFSNCSFMNNSGYYSNNGGAVYLSGSNVGEIGFGRSSGTKATFTDCSFKNNTAVAGGAIFVGNSNVTDGIFTRCDFTNNTATGEYGGGGVVYLATVGDDWHPWELGKGANAVFTECDFSQNTNIDRGGASGGGVMRVLDNNATATFTACLFASNTSTTGINDMTRDGNTSNITFACGDGEVGTPVQMQGHEITVIPPKELQCTKMYYCPNGGTQGCVPCDFTGCKGIKNQTECNNVFPSGCPKRPHWD